jgi:Zn-finger nucleic acid-binding protein
MIVVEFRRIEIDYCIKCSGIWFDKGELELLLGTTEAGNSGLPTLEGKNGQPRSHGDRKCPICHKNMGEVPLGEPAVHVDVCRRGDGIWFDGGELQQVLKQAAPGSPADKGAMKQIADFLGEALNPGPSDKSGA